VVANLTIAIATTTPTAFDPDVAAAATLPAALLPDVTRALTLVVAVPPDPAATIARPPALDPDVSGARIDDDDARRRWFLFDLRVDDRGANATMCTYNTAGAGRRDEACHGEATE
jgi:hypothetical protein